MYIQIDSLPCRRVTIFSQLFKKRMDFSSAEIIFGTDSTKRQTGELRYIRAQPGR